MAKGKNNIKKPAYSKGGKIKVDNSVSNIAVVENYPIFCLRHLHKDYHTDLCTNEEKVGLITKLVKLSTMSWTEIKAAHKHGLGSEKIARDSIKVAIPSEITEDVKDFLAFRFLGKAPFVGYRNKHVFHIVYVDRAFTLYDH